MIRRVILASMSTIALTTAAAAADVYVPSAANGYKDDIIAVAAWTGFYAGINGGGAFGQDPGDVTIIRPGGTTATIPGLQPGGGFGGGQAGYNWQGIWHPHLVLGIEADIQGSDISDKINFLPNGVTASRSSQVNVDWFGTVRGRVGYALNGALVYATGGFAYGSVNYKVRNGVNTVIYTNDGDTETGYAAGGGLEYKINPSWSVKGEYQFISLGGFDLRDPIVPAAHARDAEVDIRTLRLGLNYQLNQVVSPLK
jgi:outer membrane immunogenic protein